MKRRAFLKQTGLTLLALAVSRGIAMAASDEWEKLSDAERKALEEKWAYFQSLPAARQAELKAAYEKYLSLSEAEKSAVQENFRKWQQMSAEEKAELKRKFTLWQELSEQEREFVRKHYESWDTMTEEEKKAALETIREKIRSAK
jgi:hypothetical protein